jgi:hypothetical protein
VVINHGDGIIVETMSINQMIGITTVTLGSIAVKELTLQMTKGGAI